MESPRASSGSRVFADRIDIPSPAGREGGVKYTDYAIGEFIAQARTKPWFADTLFIITADHCAAVAGEPRLPVEKSRIPLIMYAPAMVKPGFRNARRDAGRT